MGRRRRFNIGNFFRRDVGNFFRRDVGNFFKRDFVNFFNRAFDTRVCDGYARERDAVQRTVNALNIQKNQLNNEINECTNVNSRVIIKNNALLDTTQYYNNQLFGYTDPNGTNSIKGYVNTALDVENEKTKIVNDKIKNVNDKIKNVNDPTSIKEGLSSACDHYRRKRDEFQRQRDQLYIDIRNLTNIKNDCIAKNTKVVKKNNALIDTVNYYHEQLFGYNDEEGKNSIKGYLKTIIDTQSQKDDIVNQKLGQSTDMGKTSENFDSMYNKVFLENNVIQNQITMDKEKHSVDNQKYKDLVNQIDRLKQIDIITSIILLIIIIASGTIIWFSKKTLAHKFVMVKVVWLYVILIEILEYVLFYAYIYVRAFVFGEQSTYKDYWHFPHVSWLDIVILVLIALSVFI